MAVIKCKMCGGDLQIVEGNSVCECEYCGSKQTVPIADNEKKMTLFARANRLLRNCEFDKASGVFESIVAEFPEEAEAYWGLVLCKYGIEYVDDPATGKKIPTCHRSSFDSVLDDSDFEQACENTDAIARRVYRDEARQIEALRQAILQVSGKEDPYDIFISYKETDENGDRTLDSVVAQNIYKELTNDGYRVFFSRISLEDKLGTEYEPYIFAALNSAKVMLVVGTDYENFDSVWVKNEWSRFLKLIASGQKKTLIPVFKNMDAYDMPKDFAKLAAQDMGKIGAMQDLLHGVKKLIPCRKELESQTKETVIVQQSSGINITALIKRGNLALQDGEWDKAHSFFDQALNIDAENADAYLGIGLSEEQSHNYDDYIQKATSRNPIIKKKYIRKNLEHIKKAKEENPESFPAQLYDFDLSYPSEVEGQKEIKCEEEERFLNNRWFKRAIEFSHGKDSSSALHFKQELFDLLARKINDAEEREEKARYTRERAYELHMNEADKKAAEIRDRQEQNRKKRQLIAENAYQQADKLISVAISVDDYSKAALLFRSADIHDSLKRAQECEERIAVFRSQIKIANGEVSAIIEENKRITERLRQQHETEKRINEQIQKAITEKLQIENQCLDIEKDISNTSSLFQARKKGQLRVLLSEAQNKKKVVETEIAKLQQQLLQLKNEVFEAPNMTVQNYNVALVYYSHGMLNNAEEFFEKVPGYQDADKYISLISEKKLKRGRTLNEISSKERVQIEKKDQATLKSPLTLLEAEHYIKGMEKVDALAFLSDALYYELITDDDYNVITSQL